MVSSKSLINQQSSHSVNKYNKNFPDIKFIGRILICIKCPESVILHAQSPLPLKPWNCFFMEKKHIVDMHAWPRQEHYRYFGELDDPYFGITAKADFTSCYMQSKQDGASFFLYSLHKILRAANAIDEFRYRVEDGNIVLYDLIGASPTIGREDGSFGIGRTEPRACRRIPCRAVFQTVEYTLVYMDSSLKDNIKVIAFDADDTLWANQPYFDDAEDRLCSILAEYGEPRYIKSELFKTEMQNMPGVKDTLEKISRSCSYRTIVITKGNMLDQERKLECSGLKPFFDHVEIVSDKNGKTYSDLLAFLGIGASEFLMVGNSFKSDISPVLRLGGYGVYIPFHTTWLHEQTDEYDHPNLFRADNFRELENIVL